MTRTFALLTLSLVAALMAVDCASPGATQPLCVSGATRATDRFAVARGCITYNDGSQIWAVDPKNTSNHSSLGPSHGLTSMVWSRDGSRLLLVEQTNSGVAHEDLYVMNADGSQTRLTSDGGSTGGSFSPDGTKVAFARANEGVYVVVYATGGTPRLIARSYTAWWLDSPAWSPDGLRIAYTVYLEGGPEGLTFQIWTMSPDGTNPRQLLDLGPCGGGGCSGGLAWSPDGSKLAFHSMRDNLSTRTRAIYVVNEDGSGLRRINDDGAGPSWSPDGSRIAFSRGQDVFTMAADGADITQLEGVVFVQNGDAIASGLAWNPVG